MGPWFFCPKSRYNCWNFVGFLLSDWDVDDPLFVVSFDFELFDIVGLFWLEGSERVEEGLSESADTEPDTLDDLIWINLSNGPLFWNWEESSFLLLGFWIVFILRLLVSLSRCASLCEEINVSLLFDTKEELESGVAFSSVSTSGEGECCKLEGEKEWE